MASDTPHTRSEAAPVLASGIGALLLALALLGSATGCRRAATRAAAPPRADSTARPESARGPDSSRAARAGGNGYAFTPAESAAIDDFLRRNPNLRVAVDSDRRKGNDGDAELRSLYGVYHAYFVRGDLNDDGVLDFVLAFVRRDLGATTPWFSVVVFAGRNAEGGAPADFASGTFLERDVTLARGDVSVDRDSVVISPDLDDETVRRYRWDPASHTFVFVRDDGDDAEAPSLSQTRGPARGRAPSGRS